MRLTEAEKDTTQVTSELIRETFFFQKSTENKYIPCAKPVGYFQEFGLFLCHDWPLQTNLLDAITVRSR